MGYCYEIRPEDKDDKFVKCDGRNKLCDRGLDINTWNGLNNGCPSFCYTLKEAKEARKELAKMIGHNYYTDYAIGGI